MTITGTNLADATAVAFGAAGPASGVSCTETSCTAVTPAGTVGTVDIQITTPGGGASTPNTADRYTYTATTPTCPGAGSGTGGNSGCSTTTTVPGVTPTTIPRLPLTGEQPTIPLACAASALFLVLAACHLRRRANS